MNHKKTKILSEFKADLKNENKIKPDVNACCEKKIKC